MPLQGSFPHNAWMTPCRRLSTFNKRIYRETRLLLQNKPIVRAIYVNIRVGDISNGYTFFLNNKKKI